MALGQIQTDLDTFFKTNVDDALAGVPFFYDNQKGAGKSSNTLGWGRHSVAYDENTFSALGNKNLRNFGTVLVQVFIPAGEGKAKSKPITDAIEDAYTGQCTNNIRFQTVTNPFNGSSGDWYQMNINISFYVDETRS